MISEVINDYKLFGIATKCSNGVNCEDGYIDGIRADSLSVASLD